MQVFGRTFQKDGITGLQSHVGHPSAEIFPMAVNGQVVIQPMMYLALSYDHRIIDGKTAVQFLVAIKDLIEDPARILLQL